MDNDTKIVSTIEILWKMDKELKSEFDYVILGTNFENSVLAGYVVFWDFFICIVLYQE